jgi:uncharacterized SAM-binding protein YcdF (DUF218 family)
LVKAGPQCYNLLMADAEQAPPTAATSPTAARPSHGSRRAATLVVGLAFADVMLCLLLWHQAPSIKPRDSIPEAAPIVVFYSPIEAERAARLEATRQLFLRHGPRKILLVGGARPRQFYFGSIAMADELAAGGIPMRWLKTEMRSNDTQTNVAAAIELAAGERRLLVVSDRLHLARILPALAEQAPDVEAIAVDCGGPELVWPRLWRLHYEALAWMASVLPDRWRQSIIGLFRA